MIKGVQKESGNGQYSKYVGLEALKPICFNPDKEKLSEILGTEIKEEPVYTDKQDKNGNDMSTIMIWAEGQKTGQKFPIRFTIINKERVSTKNPDNKQYINTVGMASYADDISSLPGWFTDFTDREGQSIGKKGLRVAHVGEAELYDFLRNWFRFSPYDVNTEIALDFNRLMAGDMRELNKWVPTDQVQSVLCGLTVRNVEKDGEIKQYQGVSTKGFLPGKFINYLTLGAFPKKEQNTWNKFTRKFEGEYGEKDIYSLELVHEYDGSDITATNNAKRDEVLEDDSSF